MALPSRKRLWPAEVLDRLARRETTCPEGHTSVEWRPRIHNRGSNVVQISSSTADCGACPRRSLCTRSKAKYPRRRILIRSREQHEALMYAREREKTANYLRQYAKRPGSRAPSRGQDLRNTPVQVYWVGQDPPAAPLERGGFKFPAGGRVARGCAETQAPMPRSPD